jgi:hypothetical protein
VAEAEPPRDGDEYREYVEKLERERLEDMGDAKEQLAHALEVAAENSEDESDRIQADASAKAMRAAAEEYRRYAMSLEDGEE